MRVNHTRTLQAHISILRTEYQYLYRIKYECTTPIKKLAEFLKKLGDDDPVMSTSGEIYFTDSGPFRVAKNTAFNRSDHACNLLQQAGQSKWGVEIYPEMMDREYTDEQFYNLIMLGVELISTPISENETAVSLAEQLDDALLRPIAPVKDGRLGERTWMVAALATFLSGAITAGARTAKSRLGGTAMTAVTFYVFANTLNEKIMKKGLRYGGFPEGERRTKTIVPLDSFEERELQAKEAKAMLHLLISSKATEATTSPLTAHSSTFSTPKDSAKKTGTVADATRDEEVAKNKSNGFSFSTCAIM